VTPIKTKKKAARIRHVYGRELAASEADGWEAIPRGWIRPDGKFFKTKQHWIKISGYLGHKGATRKDPEQGEKNAHAAYSLGWISIGHGGALNAVGHKSSFDLAKHPGVQTLRKLLSSVPQFSIRIERQMGKIDPETGMHEDFDVREYDLDLFIRHGRLRKYA